MIDTATTPGAPNAPLAPAIQKVDPKGDVVVWGHAGIFFWWPLWLYGYFCGFITHMFGTEMQLGDGPVFKVYEESWPGVAFLTLLLLIIMFSAWRIKSYVAVVGILAVIVAIEVLIRTGYWDGVLGWLISPVIYLNLAFYLVFSSVLLFVWITSVFFLDRLTFWRIQPGQVQEVHVLDHIDDRTYPSMLMTVHRKPVDFMRRLLGLFRTGDLVIASSDGRYNVTIPNVWSIDSKINRITGIIHARKSA